MLRTSIVVIISLVAGIFVALAAVSFGWLDPRSRSISSKEWGEFPNSPKVEMLTDGRTIQLLEDFAYVDPRKKTWVARKDLVADGASIPQVFWTFTGGPLEGQYRNASIIHDDACERQSEKWEDVHLMFYEACRCGGVPENKAKLLYAAVYHFGPRWEVEFVPMTRRIERDGRPTDVHFRAAVRRARAVAVPNKPDVPRRLEKFVKERDRSLKELREVNPNDL